LDWAFADQWTLVAGGRYVKEKKDYSFFQGVYQSTDDRIINSSVLYATLFPFHPFNTDDNLYAGKLQLEYRPLPDVLIYLGVNRGAKAGGFNAQLADGSPRLPLSGIPYKPENLTNYEGGVKSTFLDGKLRTNASVFYYSYKDYQAFLFEQSSGVVVNKDAFMRGGEFEVTASPISGLEVQVGVSGFQAIVKGLELQGPAGVAPIFQDVHPSFAPEKQVSALIRYSWPLAGGRIAAQIDTHYTSDFYHNLRNFEADHYPGYTISNARVAWTDEHWEVAAFVKNFTDKRYYTIGYDLATLCGCNENAFGPPIWPGVEVSYHFGK
jgi:iron complex outermembrane receptor protein